MLMTTHYANNQNKKKNRVLNKKPNKGHDSYFYVHFTNFQADFSISDFYSLILLTIS